MPSGIFWSENDVKFLIENYEKLGTRKCAEFLGRTEGSITTKVNTLNKKLPIKLIRRGVGRKTRRYLVDGYLRVSDYNENYFVHRRVMEDHLGRTLNPDEIVHHIDGDKTNNDLSNLRLETRSSHMKGHDADRDRDTKGRFMPTKSESKI